MLRPLLSMIRVVDKRGVQADTADITLKVTQQMIVPDSGTDVSVSLRHQNFLFKGVSTGLKHFRCTKAVSRSAQIALYISLYNAISSVLDTTFI